jgi:hypothetical protein
MPAVAEACTAEAADFLAARAVFTEAATVAAITGDIRVAATVVTDPTMVLVPQRTGTTQVRTVRRLVGRGLGRAVTALGIPLPDGTSFLPETAAWLAPERRVPASDPALLQQEAILVSR